MHLAQVHECRPLSVSHAHAGPRRGQKPRTNLRCNADACARSPCRREQLPLTCRAFAAACDDIIWDSVRVDARQSKRQTWTAMTWERVEPWLSKRAGNICGIDLRRASDSGPRCDMLCMQAGQTVPWPILLHCAVIPSVISSVWHMHALELYRSTRAMQAERQHGQPSAVAAGGGRCRAHWQVPQP
jgi:hypothetical protein